MSKIPQRNIPEEYIAAYRRKQDLEDALKLAKRELDVIKIDLINLMTSLGLSSVKNEATGVSLSHTVRTYPYVSDFKELYQWCREQGEPMSEWTEPKFKQGKEGGQPVGITAILEEAKEAVLREGGTIEDHLPTGLKVNVVDVITVRQPKSNGEKATLPLTSKEMLKDIMGE